MSRASLPPPWLRPSCAPGREGNGVVSGVAKCQARLRCFAYSEASTLSSAPVSVASAQSAVVLRSFCEHACHPGVGRHLLLGARVRYVVWKSGNTRWSSYGCPTRLRDVGEEELCAQTSWATMAAATTMTASTPQTAVPTPATASPRARPASSPAAALAAMATPWTVRLHSTSIAEQFGWNGPQ